jgi:hypothetical protein
MSTLHNYRLFAVTVDGDLVPLRGVANFNEAGARDMGRNRVKHMTRIQRYNLRLTKHAQIIVQEYIADVDR